MQIGLRQEYKFSNHIFFSGAFHSFKMLTTFILCFTEGGLHQPHLNRHLA